MHERKKKNSKKIDAVSVGSKYHFAQRSPVNKVDIVSKMVFVCSTRLVRHKMTITKRKSDAGKSGEFCSHSRGGGQHGGFCKLRQSPCGEL